MKITPAFCAAFALAVTACVSQPLGPTVSVLPAPGTPFEKFQEEDAYCRQYANQQIAGAPGQANSQLIGSAVIGTLLGAGLGAAVGGGEGAAFGAGAGTLIGTGMASGQTAWDQMSIQQRYNIAYMQCMYAKGHRVPGYTVVPGTVTPVVPAPPPPAPPPVP